MPDRLTEASAAGGQTGTGSGDVIPDTGFGSGVGEPAGWTGTNTGAGGTGAANAGSAGNATTDDKPATNVTASM